MPDFGSYTSVQRLYAGSVGALYSVKSGASPDLRAARILQPPLLWDEDKAKSETAFFLARAKIQQKMAEASPHWAPIHETGTVPSDDGPPAAYYITDLYSRTAARLIEGKVKLSPEDLRTLLLAVAHGLNDINTRLGRPHGNLHPANVLLSSPEIAKARIVLSDPAADALLDKSAGANADLLALGELLYQLVLQRPSSAGAAAAGKEWADLGKAGDAFRDLCNLLLNTHAPADQRNLANVIAQLEALKIPKKRSPVGLAAVAAVLLCLIGVSVWFFFIREPPRQYNEANWKRLCTEYIAWYQPFDARYNGEGSDPVRKAFHNDPLYPHQIEQILAKAAADNVSLDPRDIAGTKTRPEALLDQPPDAVKVSAAVRKTEDALLVYDAISAVLDGARQPAPPERWPTLTRLQALSVSFDSRGWKNAATFLRDRAVDVKPRTVTEPAATPPKILPIDLVDSIQSAVAAARTADQLEKDRAALDAPLAALTAAGNPLLTEFPNFMARYLAPEKPVASVDDLTAFDARLQELSALAAKLVAEARGVNGKVYWTELAQDPDAPKPAGITLDQYTRLLTLVKKYYELPKASDPRNVLDWDAELARIDGFIHELEQDNPTFPDLPKYKATLQAQEKAVAAFWPLKKPIFPIAAQPLIAPIDKNRETIKTMVTAAEEALSGLEKAVAANLVKPDVWIAEHKSWTFRDKSPILAGTWKTHHEALLALVEPDPNKLKVYDFRKGLEKKFDDLRDRLTDLGKSLPADIPNAPLQEPWQQQVVDSQVTAHREAVLTTLVKALAFSQDVPNTLDPAFVSTWTAAKTAYLARSDDIRKLITTLVTVSDRLDHFYLRADEPTPGAPAYNTLYDPWKTSELLKDPAILAAIKPLQDRIDADEALAAQTTPAPLLAADASVHKEVALIAWRRLGQIAWSAATPTLDDELKLQKGVTAALASATGTIVPAWKTTLDSELTTDTPARWLKHFATLADRAPIEAALDRRAEFKVPDASLPRWALYNNELYKLRQVDTKQKDDVLKARITAFAAFVNEKPDEVSQDPAIQAILKEFDKLLNQKADAGITKSGPELAGWTAVPPADPAAPFVFTWESPPPSQTKYKLEFVPLQIGDKTTYLCTTTVSVGLFADVIAAGKHFDEVAHFFSLPAPGEPDSWLGTGPKVWKVENKAFTLNPATDWLSRDSRLPDNVPLTAPNINLPPDSFDLPMQRVSPYAAFYIARLLGCRFPTTTEWQTAYDKFEKNAPPNAALPLWNLRDATWQIQLDHAKPQNGKLDWPDAGIFLPPAADVKRHADALIWTRAALHALAPNRIPDGPTYDDGSLFFRVSRAASPGQMLDLVGNVAIYVSDAAAQFPALKAAGITAADARKTIEADRDKTFVVGGSAMSPPEIPFDKPQKIDWTAVNDGFSDVGFRLAFTAPIESIPEGLARIRDKAPYLPGPLARKN